ncbi:MAG: hypothetical protein AAB448_00100 [Patescibacteria group bacterium]
MAQQKSQPVLEEELLPVVRKIATWVFGISWVLGTVLLCWRILPLVYGRDSVPLHYNIYVGIDAFGPWWMLFEVVVLSLAIALVNALFAATLLKKRPMLALATWSATLFVGILTLMALVRIVLINIAYG